MNGLELEMNIDLAQEKEKVRSFLGKYPIATKHVDYFSGIERFSDLRSYIESNFQKADILDMGCGVGILEFLLKEKGFNILGVDNDEEFLKIAKDLNPANEFCKLDFSDLSGIKGKFDVIIILDVFQVPSYNLRPEQIIPQLRQFLRKDGIVIFDIVPSSSYWITRKFLTTKLNSYKFKGIIQLLTDNKFSVQDVIVRKKYNAASRFVSCIASLVSVSKLYAFSPLNIIVAKDNSNA